MYCTLFSKTQNYNAKTIYECFFWWFHLFWWLWQSAHYIHIRGIHSSFFLWYFMFFKWEQTPNIYKIVHFERCEFIWIASFWSLLTKSHQTMCCSKFEFLIRLAIWANKNLNSFFFEIALEFNQKLFWMSIFSLHFEFALNGICNGAT